MNPLSLATLHKTPHGWPLRQLRIPQAHKVTRGSPDIVVAVIDLGYRFHSEHEGHLWVNPNPSRGDIHGWDCHDDDSSLEYNLWNADSTYNRGHHSFIVGEIIACAPECRVMIVRVGYENPESWWRGIDYAVAHGARVLVIPHGFITHGRCSPIPLFYRGTDFSYPLDNPEIRRALDAAYDAGCLTFRGVAENRGRRVAAAFAAIESVIAVGSTNRRGEAADIACSSDYVEVSAPSGERGGDEAREHVWSTGGDEEFIPFTGGCMAAGFGGGVGALAMSQFPGVPQSHIRQILRNTSSGTEWGPKLGWGILNAARAVSLKPELVCQKLKIRKPGAQLVSRRGRQVLRIKVSNRGALDVEKAMLVVFNGDPRRAAVPGATLQKPVTLVTRQLGHSIGPVRGLYDATFEAELTEKPGECIWVQVCTLDHHGSAEVDTVRIRL